MTTNCRLREELEQARAELAAMKQPIRVPFSDEQIEKMAEAAYDARNGGGKYAWAIDATDEGKIRWRSAIRAAVAAGGLEPCPVPEIDALRTKLARVSAKSARRRTAIKQLQKAHDGWRKLAEQRSERNKHLQQQAENRSKNYEELLKQRDILKIERDTFESAATKALDERDHRPTWEHLEKVKAEAEACDVARYAEEAQLDALHPGETVEGVVMERDHYRVQLEREQEWVNQYKADRDDAVAELAAVKADVDRLYELNINFSELLTKLKFERDNYKSMLEEEVACGAEYLERAESLGCPKDGNINDAYAWALSELAALRERAEQAEAERDDLQCESSIIGELRAILGLGWCESITQRCKELAALRERESVPVKVRWSVSDERIQTLIELGTFIRLDFDKISLLRETFAAHAVIDAPAGVPSVEELAKQHYEHRRKANKNWEVMLWEEHEHDHPDRHREYLDATAAIRDAVMAGVAWGCDQCGEYEAVRKMHAACVDARDAALLRVEYLERLYGHKEGELRGPLQAELEMKQKDIDRLRDELDARDIEDATAAPTDAQVEALAKVLENEWTAEHRSAKAAHKAQARAAFAHIGAAPGVDPDAWKTPLFIDACGDEDGDKLTAIENGFRLIHIGQCNWEYGAEDARAFAIWLASYATAHGCPVALPVREPVGWEFDVTWQKMQQWLEPDSIGRRPSPQTIIDLCRSRIRPTYECKECAGLKQKLHHAAVAWRKIMNYEANDALDAALEGE